MGSNGSSARRASLGGFVALLAVAAVVGAPFNAAWAALTAMLAAWLGWHLGHLYRLHQRLETRRRLTPPTGQGIWSQVVGSMHRRQEDSRGRKRRLLDIVREFREATVAFPDGVVILDTEFRIRWFNPGASRLMGFRKRQHLRRPLTDLMADPAVHRWLERDDETREGLIVDAPSGDRRLRLRLYRYSNKGYVMVTRDITRIQQVEAVRQDLVASVSHELRTPLTVISGYVETMAGEAGAEWAPIVERLEAQTARMRAIVEDLLTLSRLDASISPDQEVVVNVVGIVQSVASEARLLSEGRHTITCEVEEELAVLGSPNDLRSAFMNLVSNAIRYTPDGGAVSFCWYQRQDEAVFEVADNGPGIATAHVSRLTERFYRVSPDRSRATGGTGLGLAIVKNVLALHDARLEIESQVGRGSIFRCVIPEERTLTSLSEVC